MEQELFTLPEHMSSPPVFSGVRVTQSLVLCACMFCSSLFFLLYFFFWPLYCLFFFDIRIPITPLVSSNTSYSVLPDSLMYLLLQAGIPGSQLMLALEPEAASIFCKHIPSERMVTGGKSCLDAFSPGTKYLILDAGGM